MIAVYLGEIDEKKILEITYPFYTALLQEISYKLNYEAVVNILGNGSATNGITDSVNEANPFNCGAKPKVKRFTMKDAAFMK